MPKYEVKHTLLGEFGGADRPVFNPGDIVTEGQLQDAGFGDIDRLTNSRNSESYKPGFSPSVVTVRGTENDAYPSTKAAEQPAPAPDKDQITDKDKIKAQIAELQSQLQEQGDELAALRVGDLRDKATEAGIPDAANLNKGQLIAALNAKDAGGSGEQQ